MKTALYTLLLSAVFIPLNVHAAPADDEALKQLATVFHNARATGNAKSFADAAYISPEYCTSVQSLEECRTSMAEYLALGWENPNDRWKKNFTVQRIEYGNKKNQAVIHTTTTSVNGQPLIVRWKAIKIDGKWLSDNLGVEVDDAP
ncbi:hypothetical protein LVJ85_04090 [Neisseria sp. Dent CA1/247]|uniref:hypothetical protein n=1 Tax=Neisseria sp. Dent CA1/247 TaxID=2912675 RepID=UPI001FD2694B|nr:hypothetical protein [Neisseria sp. Dent CA1/247]UOO77660.1 hypothetical protein LVJ85_04090 [Neisseria sp. Dent CA1/247]